MTHPETPGETLLEGMQPAHFTRQAMGIVENMKDAIQIIMAEQQAFHDAIALLEWVVSCQYTVPTMYRVDKIKGVLSLVNEADPHDHAPLREGSRLLIARPAEKE